jgi:hypothetical protein
VPDISRAPVLLLWRLLANDGGAQMANSQRDLFWEAKAALRNPDQALEAGGPANPTNVWRRSRHHVAAGPAALQGFYEKAETRNAPPAL